MEGEKKKRGRKPKNPETFKKEIIQDVETEICETGNYLYLNSDYRVKVSTLNFDLEKKGERKSEDGTISEKWDCLGHYGSFRQLCIGLISERIKDEIGKMKDIAKAYNNLLAVLSKYPDFVFVAGELKHIERPISEKETIPNLD